ncbi:MAG: sialidase family protein [Anaerolineae bacterium]
MHTLRLAASTDVFNCNHRWPTCHCASVAQAADGRLVATWYAGTREGSRDQAILVSHCTGPTPVWEPATPVVDTPRLADGNPVVWVDEEKRLWLFYVTIVGQWWAECKVFAREAEGRGWSEPTVLRHELGWMLRARPVTLASGRVLFPWYDERDWSSHVMVRAGRDGWERRGHVTAPQGLIQPCLAQCADGTVVMYMRTGGRGGWIWRSRSVDEGETWSYPEPTGLPNPNSGIDLLAHSSGLWVLAYNPTASGRTPLTLAVSEDEGSSWRQAAVAESGPGEFSYPQMVEDDRGLVHLLYTYKRSAIRHRAYEVAP